jgi:carboxyl-terminal processing protease
MRRFRYHPLALGAVGLLITVGMATGMAAVNSSGEAGSTYGYLKLFNEALALVRHNYVEVVPENALMQGAYQGLLASLDGESEYLSAAQYRLLKATPGGEMATVGISLIRRDGFLFIASVLPGSDAEAKGLRLGDRIRRIGNRVSRDLTLSEAQRILEGEAGSTVKLAVSRSEEPHREDVTVERRKIELQAPYLDTAESAVAVVHLPTFRPGSSQTLGAIFEDLHVRKVSRVVLDLRGNAWGESEEAVLAASILAGEGVQAILKERGGEDHPVHGGGPRTAWRGELLMLTNPGTALAAELFVAALSDAGVATHAGERTLGRGGQREVLPLANGDYLILTVRKYVSPGGTAWHGAGLKPAVSIPSDPDIPFKERPARQLHRAVEWLEKEAEGEAKAA